jgi:large subunit ribosomal protein L25
MKSIEITASKRAAEGKKEINKLRAEGQVLCNLYGGDENINFSAPELSFRDLVYTPDVYIVKLNIDGAEYEAIMQDIQFHPVTDKILHIDFLQVFPDKAVTMDVPVKITGTSEGVRMGGRMILKSRRLKLKALPGALPDKVEVDVTPLVIGQQVRVGDMSIDGVEFLDAPNNIIVAIRTTRVVVSTEEETAEAPEAEGGEAAEAAAEGGEEAKSE